MDAHRDDRLGIARAGRLTRRSVILRAGAAGVALTGAVHLVRASSSRSLEAGHMFDGATGWLNSAPLTPEGLRGRVVLVDFWTYTCVNWIRTLPYVRAWAAKYADAGLTVDGVHTPEFGFEHDVENVTAATHSFSLGYPIALDNDYAVWGAFENHYWPAVYLADGDGRIRYSHLGEGEYAATEMAIQRRLRDAGAVDVPRDLLPVDDALSRGAACLAADLGLRGADATYVAVAQRLGCPLVTWDAEIVRKTVGTIDARQPSPRSCLRRRGRLPCMRRDGESTDDQWAALQAKAVLRGDLDWSPHVLDAANIRAHPPAAGANEGVIAGMAASSSAGSRPPQRQGP